MGEEVRKSVGNNVGKRVGKGVGNSKAENKAVHIELVAATTAQHIEATRAIFNEYAQQLVQHSGVDLCFQNFDAELAGLPGEYASPAGTLLLAWVNGELAGCGAMRALPDVDYANACEMKRLFVRDAFRKFGLGRLMAKALIDAARQAGYSAMLLDTLDEMEAARGLYTTLGFEEIPPYYFNPIAGAHYLKVDL